MFCMARLLLAQTAPAVDFQREIRPILSDNCFQCHGPDGAARQAGLRLDRRESALEARPNGAPIVPGKPRESLLTSGCGGGAQRRMPPPIAQAVDRGVKSRFESAGSTAALPGSNTGLSDLPSSPAAGCQRRRLGLAIRSTTSFWLAWKRRLAPSPEAERRALFRRVRSTLTGLPPTPAEVDAFLPDTSAQRLREAWSTAAGLAALRRTWRTHWLDAARYADTHGYHIDAIATCGPVATG